MNNNTKSRFKTAKNWLIFWTMFIGIGAVAGAVGMLADTSGEVMHMNAMLPYLQSLPFGDVLFQDFLFSGCALLIVNGLTNLTAAGLMIVGKSQGVTLGGIFGITLMLWICIQFYAFSVNFMSTIYFIFGLVQAATGYAAVTFLKQENFTIKETDYMNIGSNDKRLVVYFSRMGYVKKQAFEEANRTGAEIYEIKADELTEGTKGFWWCGRYGMHGWDMPIETVTAELEKYEHITICTSIWVFRIAAPVRTFCKDAAGRIKEADYIIVHHNKCRYESAADEADRLLGIKRTGFKSICCRKGTYKEV